MGKNRAKKTPKIAKGNQPLGLKSVPTGVSGEGQGHPTPLWRLSSIDWDSPWCPSKCVDQGIREIHSWMANLEGMPWVQILSNGSHVVGTDGIIPEARKRIIALGKAEWQDHLCSLRKTGKQRLWGFLRAGIFHVLWWDPEHEVYESKKKNT
ncbi:MAG: hypothetical protein RLZZ505_1965 [Verrucomicrobiota bacterium]|jgi:hypothetical protein